MYLAQQEKTPASNEFLCNVKDAYRSVQQPPLKNSDHNMINMQPIYRRKLSKSKPKEKEITCMTEGVWKRSMLALMQQTRIFL